MKLRLVFILSLLLVIITGCQEEIESIKINDALSLEEENLKIIDIRKADDFNEGSIYNSMNIPKSKFNENFLDEFDKDFKYIVISYNGDEALEIAKILKDNNFNVLYVSDGFDSWELN